MKRATPITISTMRAMSPTSAPRLVSNCGCNSLLIFGFFGGRQSASVVGDSYFGIIAKLMLAGHRMCCSVAQNGQTTRVSTSGLSAINWLSVVNTSKCRLHVGDTQVYCRLNSCSLATFRAEGYYCGFVFLS